MANLILPRRSLLPNGDVNALEVDWSHPYFRVATRAVIIVGGRYRTFAKGVEPYTAKAYAGTILTKGTPRGLAWYGTGSGTKINLSPVIPTLTTLLLDAWSTALRTGKDGATNYYGYITATPSLVSFGNGAVPSSAARRNWSWPSPQRGVCIRPDANAANAPAVYTDGAAATVSYVSGTATYYSWGDSSTYWDVGYDPGNATTSQTDTLTLAAFVDWSVPDDIMARVSADPWQIFKPARRVLYFTAGGGAGQALDGSALASATASGALTTGIPLTGAANAASSSSGSLTAGIRLTGSANAASTSFGVLSTAIPLTGAAAVASTASGGLTTAIPLTGAAASVSIVGGNLTATIKLSGSSIAQAFAQAGLDSAILLSGSATASASAAASLTTQISLSGAAIASALATANLTTTPSGLTGQASASASASGALLTQIPLVGAAQAFSIAAGGITTHIPLSGAAASVSSASGALTIETTISGAAIAEAVASGTLSTQISLSGSALSRAAAFGSLGAGTELPAALPHLVEATRSDWTVRADDSDWTVKADNGPWEIAA